MARNSLDMNLIENAWNIMQNETGNEILCKTKIFGSDYVKRSIV